MIDSLFRTAVPLVLARLADVPLQDKLEYAFLLESLACAFREDRRDDFAVALVRTSFPPDLQKQIVAALWAGEPVK